METEVDYGRLAPYRRALRALVEEDLQAFEAALAAEPAVLAENAELPLLHYAFQFFEGPLLQAFLGACTRAGGDLGIRSTDSLAQVRGELSVGLCCVGGQTLLHVAARRSAFDAGAFAALRAAHPTLDVPDCNGRTPSYYLELRGRWTPQHHSAEHAAVKARCALALIDVSPAEATPVVLEPDLQLGLRCFSLAPALAAALRASIAQVEARLPNSMHRSGRVLLPRLRAEVHALVKALLPHAHQQRSIRHLHAFSVAYDLAGANTSLAAHRDDSHYTINLCLFTDAVGGDLQFEGLRCPRGSCGSGGAAEAAACGSGAAAAAGGAGGSAPCAGGGGGEEPGEAIVYRHQTARGIVHRGSLVHRVLPLVGGVRENMIIWVTLADDAPLRPGLCTPAPVPPTAPVPSWPALPWPFPSCPMSLLLPLVAAYNACFMAWTYATLASPSDVPILAASYAGLAAYYCLGRALLRRAGGPDELKRRSWLLGLAASLVLSLLSLPVAARLLLAPPPAFALAVSTDAALPWARPALLFFSAELVLDLALGALDYPAQVHALSGLVHHSAFLLGGWMALRHRACGFFLGGAAAELPTLVLALGSMHRPWRMDLGYGLAFFALRVVYPAWYTCRLALHTAMPAFAGMMAAALGLNLVWFWGWAVSFRKGAGGGRHAQAAGAPGAEAIKQHSM